jgi:hypothetical protein
VARSQFITMIQKGAGAGRKDVLVPKLYNVLARSMRSLSILRPGSPPENMLTLSDQDVIGSSSLRHPLDLRSYLNRSMINVLWRCSLQFDLTG